MRLPHSAALLRNPHSFLTHLSMSTVAGRPLSRSSEITQELAERVAAEVRGLVGRDDEVWAVTHSMGGIILRHMQALPDQGRLPNAAASGS